MTFVLYDLEFTAWEDSLETMWAEEGRHREVIAIAAIRVNDNREEVETFTSYVSPSQDVSDYIVDLTGIPRETIRDGQRFPDALQAFNDFIDDTTAWSYGNDAVIIGENIALNSCEEHLPRAPLNNIKPFINDADPETTILNSGKLADHCGKDVDGDEHNPLYDCRSILAAIKHLVSTNHILRKLFEEMLEENR